MRSRCCMDLVNALCCNINCTLEAKRHICSPQVIVYRLWQSYDIQSLFTQQIGSLMCSITTKNHKTVKIELVIVLLHGCNLIQTILIRVTHILEWTS